MNKKGSIEDLFFLIIMLIGLGIFIIVLACVIPMVTDGMRQTAMNDSAEVRAALLNSDEISGQRLDGIYLIVFGGLVISIIISSFLIDSHPIFIPIFIILFAFAVVVGVIMENVYEEFVENSVLNQTASTQTIQIAVTNNLIPILVGVGVICMIIIYGKRRVKEGGI